MTRNNNFFKIVCSFYTPIGRLLLFSCLTAAILGWTTSTIWALGTQKFFIMIQSNATSAQTLKHPFYTQLASQGTLFTNYSAITHPALPNFLALTGGSTFGVTTNGPVDLSETNLVDLLEAKGITWKLYIENLPGLCFTGQSLLIEPGCHVNSYQRWNNPFISYLDVSTDATRCAKIVDAQEFYNDVTTNSVPDFAFYISNPVNSSNSTDLVYSDQLLQYFFTLPLANHSFMKDRVFALIFDQGNNTTNNVYAVFVGPHVLANTTVNTAYNHYSLLSTIEANYNLGNLGRNDVTPPMVGWQK